MEQIFTCILLLSFSVALAKYVYIKDKKTWREAQSYCRQNYTDLAPVSNEHDRYKLLHAFGLTDPMWIGPQRNFTEKWTWSGGGGVSKFFWAPGQPDKGQCGQHGGIRDFMMYDFKENEECSFFCYRVFVVTERKTWEEALQHCRKHHSDLASVASETEMLLIRRELIKHDTTKRVWIGLHFFPGNWLWVDGQPLEYEAWGGAGKPACPQVRRGCAALRMTGGCKDGTAAEGAGATRSDGNVGANSGMKGSDRDVSAEDVTAGVWKAYDCKERLDFICY